MNDLTERHVIHPPVTSHLPDGTTITASDEGHPFPAGLIEQRAQVHIARARRCGRKVENAIDVASFGSAV